MFNYSNTNDMVVESGDSTDFEPNQGLRSVLGDVVLGDVVAPTQGRPAIAEHDLTSWEIYEDQLSYHGALEMDLPVAKVDAKLDRRVLIRDVMRYATVDVDGVEQDYGVAIRLVVTVAAETLDAALTIPIVAANAELGRLSAAARLRVIGFRSNKVGDLLPDFATLDVGNYGKYTASTDAIRGYISKNADAIVPVLLRTASRPDDKDSRMLVTTATSRALRAVANRESLDALLRSIADRWPEYSAAVTEEYAYLAPGIKRGDQPTKEQAEGAREWMAWL